MPVLGDAAVPPAVATELGLFKPNLSLYRAADGPKLLFDGATALDLLRDC